MRIIALSTIEHDGRRVPQGEALVLDDAAAMALVKAGAASIDRVYSDDAADEAGTEPDANDPADEAGTEPDATDQADEAGAEPDATPRRKKR